MLRFRLAPLLLSLLTVAGWASDRLEGLAGGRRPFMILGRDQGLPPGAVVSIAQDPEGFIWLGSENGLVRYDGGHCRMWTTEEGLPSSYISKILATEEGLWLPTLRGLVRFKDGRIERAFLDGEPSTNAVGYAAQDRRGRVWVASSKGIFVQREGLHFDLFPGRPGWSLSGLVAGPRSGAIYAIGRGGILAFLPDGSTRTWGPGEGLPKDGVPLMVEDGTGRIWAGNGRMLVTKGPDEARFTDRSALLPGSLSPNSVPFVDRDGSVWLPTQNGVLHLLREGVERVDAASGLPFRWARTLFRDREGTLWVVGPALARLQGGGRVFNYALSEGAAGEVVWWVTRDLQGRLLVGTDDGAARMGPRGLERVPGTEGWRIKSLAQDRAGTLWMVNTTGPALWLRPGASKAEPAPLGDYGTYVNSVTEDSQGRLWFGHTRHGVLRWDARARRLVQEVGPEFVNATAMGAFLFREDAAGRLWVGSTAGLLVRERDGRWRLFTERDGLKPHYVRGMAFLPDGSAWIHYQEPQGLTRVRLDADGLKVLEHRTKGKGLRTNLVYGIQVDAEGHPWISTDEGIDRLDLPLHVGRQDGMVSEDCSIHAFLLEGDRAWVGTGGGLVRFDHAEEPARLPAPQAHVVEIAFGGRRLEPPLGFFGPIAHRDSTVSFRVAAPTYQRERDLRLQVRLGGLEEGWRDLEGQVARYAALAGGHYRFEVRAANGEGPFGPPVGVDFSVRPPWWLTWWALTGWVLAGIGAALALSRYRVAALARSKAALEALVDRRTEELRTRNGELTEALTQVKQLSGLLPICSCCKKIRDDGGYWNQLEHYISAHSEADFTHGICPDCAHVMFPEIRAAQLKEPPPPA